MAETTMKLGLDNLNPAPGSHRARKRLGLCIVVIALFFAGGIAGAWLFSLVGYGALYVPAALTGVTGIAYVVYRQQQLLGAGP